jgi:hypothetical protein
LQVGLITSGMLLAGCSGSSADSEQIRESLQSWCQSVDFAKQQWSEHRVPNTYLVQVLRAARKAEKKEAEQIGKAAGAGNVEALAAQARQLRFKIMEATGELSPANGSGR